MKIAADLPKILKSKVKIRFQDCDPFNHLNNAKYLDYFVNAREDQLIDNYQLDIFQLARKQGIAWVTSSNQIAYIRPVMTMEEVTIESELIQFSPRHLQVEARMLDLENSAIKAFCWMNFAHFNLIQSKAMNHSEEFMQFFSKIHSPLECGVFEEREIYFRKQHKMVR
ncbi:MAG: acyl-CoA thioesterase [Saprospiraceae bacterium]|nr:acyl-CoA thioesterase [Saprospiraceae bacterium]